MFLFFLLVCGIPAGAAEPARSGTGTTPGAGSVVLITLDTTRADHLGAWGHAEAQTPNLDRLAARGTRFSRCDTAAPITLPSHASILTGLFPPRHGVRDNGTFVLGDKIDTVGERFAAAGFDTAAVVSAIVLARRHGLQQGFHFYEDDLGAGYAAGTEVAERHAAESTDVALSVLAKLKKPFFLWVHYYDPHEEYRPPSKFADAAKGPQRLYDGEIAYVDSEIGRLLAALPRETNVVVVGDHGEMLGEQGERTHGLLLARGVRRVPLLLAGPGVPAAQLSDCLVRTVDVAPTLLSLGGLAVPSGLDGESLLPLPAGAACDRLSYTESFLPFFAYAWYPLRSLSDGRFLFLQAPRPSLFRLSDDPDEKKDVGTADGGLLASWGKRLEALLTKMGERLGTAIKAENVLTADQRRQLEGLGYLGSANAAPARVVSPDLPDPRQRVEVAQQLHDAARQVQEAKCREALPVLQKIVKEEPHNFPALTLAGSCLRETGKLDTALTLLQQASRENELSAVPVANAAGVLLTLGRKTEAEREYRHALALDPSLAEAAENLARLLRERGDRNGAVAVLNEALRDGAFAAEVYLERGVARAELGKLADALADFREAYHRDPANPVPLENAARATYQLSRFRESAQLYEQLLQITPGRLDLLKTLGSIYLYDLDDRQSALAVFRRALAREGDPEEKEKLQELITELGG